MNVFWNLDSILLANQIPESNLQIGQTVGLLLRPEMIRLEPLQQEESVKLEGTVIDMVYLGALKRYPSIWEVSS